MHNDLDRVFLYGTSQPKKGIEVSKTKNTGSEGTIYRPNDDKYCFKVFDRNGFNKKKEDKLWLMMDGGYRSIKNTYLDGNKLFNGAANASPPDSSSKNLSFVCWPEFLISDRPNGKVIGYCMRHVPNASLLENAFFETSELSAALKPEDRIYIATCICLLLDEIHKAGAIIGDFQPNNILVAKNDTWSVHIIDTDSFQLQSGRKTFTSNIGRADYSRPKLMKGVLAQAPTNEIRELEKQENWIGIIRHKNDDKFALAIIIFRLIFKFHPFDNIEEKSIIKSIAERKFYYHDKPRFLQPAAPTELFNRIPDSLRSMFYNSFVLSKQYSGAEWISALLGNQTSSTPPEDTPSEYPPIDVESVKLRSAHSKSTLAKKEKPNIRPDNIKTAKSSPNTQPDSVNAKEEAPTSRSLSQEQESESLHLHQLELEKKKIARIRYFLTLAVVVVLAAIFIYEAN